METTGTTNTRTQVATLTAANYSVRQISEMLGVSETTVSYHRRNEKNGTVAKPKQTLREPDAQAYGHIADTHAKVKTMSLDGYSVAGIAKALNISDSAVSYHRRKKEPVQLTLAL